jgi:hypothetical protein
MKEAGTPDDSALTIGNREIPYETRRVPIGDLRYYEDNPRIFSLIAGKGLKDDQAGIENEIWNIPSTKELFTDIKINGGLLEEVIVADGCVLEGNRRLCVYRKLAELAGTEQEKSRWLSIPAKVITTTVSPEDVFVLLGTLHVKGKVEWKPYEQAGFIYRMKHRFGKDEEEICRLINLKMHNVASMLRAYELMLQEGIEDQTKYSYFLEYTKRPAFAALRAKDPDLEKKVVSLIKEDRIPRAEDIRRLPEILGDKRAQKDFVLRKTEFDDALTTANARNPEQVDVFYRALHQAREKLRDAPVVEIVQDIEQDHNKRSKIDYFFKEVDKFRKAIKWKGRD